MFHMVLDTEAAPIVKTDAVDGRLMRVYDLGFVVMDGNGEIVDERNVAILDTFKRSDVMANAYYADKLPQYFYKMQTNALPSLSLKDTRTMVADVIKEYGIKNVWAYNCRFDYQALNATITEYSGGFVKYFFPYSARILDVASVAGKTICATKKYVSWCRDHGFVTAKGNPKTSAEVVYRYITKNAEFVESHTALDDAKIEAAILDKALRYRKTTLKDAKAWGTGWRTAAKIAQSM